MFYISIYNYNLLIRDLVFPQDNNRYIELKDCIRYLLSKKVNQRSCNIQKLKSSNFFIDFNWDELVDFKSKPPYIPETWDWTKNLGNILTPFEPAIQVINIFFNKYRMI